MLCEHLVFSGTGPGGGFPRRPSRIVLLAKFARLGLAGCPRRSLVFLLPKPCRRRRYRRDQLQRPEPRMSAARYSSVRISIPSSHTVRQLRQFGTPLSVTRHSKHMPMPQSGPLASPAAERRKQSTPAWVRAAARLVPALTLRSFPFTWMFTRSAILMRQP